MKKCHLEAGLLTYALIAIVAILIDLSVELVSSAGRTNHALKADYIVFLTLLVAALRWVQGGHPTAPLTELSPLFKGLALASIILGIWGMLGIRMFTSIGAASLDNGWTGVSLALLLKTGCYHRPGPACSRLCSYSACLEISLCQDVNFY